MDPANEPNHGSLQHWVPRPVDQSAIPHDTLDFQPAAGRRLGSGGDRRDFGRRSKLDSVYRRGW